MASNAAKVKRKAEALNVLRFRSALLAAQLGIEVPEVMPSHHDPELAQIIQIEAINTLLADVLRAGGVDLPDEVVESEPQADETATEAVTEPKKATKKASKRSRK